jgi:hypothetical protein
MKKQNRQVSKQTLENLINNKEYFKITSIDSTCKTAVGYVGNRSLRISIIYYLKSAVFTDLVSQEQLIYTLT